MQGLRIGQFEDDTTLNVIGHLFRPISGGAWELSLCLSPSQNTRSLRFSMAPVLVRERLYNPVQKAEKKNAKEQLLILDASRWQTCRFSDCPAYQSTNKKELQQYCFSIPTPSGKMIYLPQFELARALFFHDGYMARAALVPNQLVMDFDVQVSWEFDKANINVMPHYPVTSLNEPSARSILSWILLDESACQSFNSIAQYQMLKGQNLGVHREWNFQFNPPPLGNVELELRGKYDDKTKSFFAFEIESIKNVRVDIPSLIEFYHPKFKEYVKGKGQREQGYSGEPPEEYIVTDEDRVVYEENVTLRPPLVSFEFTQPFKTVKRPKERKPSVAGKNEDDHEAELLGEDVSVGDKNASGDLPGGEFEGAVDDTDHSYIYLNKFECFQKMLKLLTTKYGCDVSVNLRKLKRRGRSSNHLLSSTGEARYFLDACIKSGSSVFHALELDMSDGRHYLSTMLLELPSENSWLEHIEILESELQRLSLRWPSKYLTMLCGKDHYRGVAHPETSYHNGKLEAAIIEHWAERFFGWIDQLGK
ncbi:Tn7-like element transposition protein TnsE [Thalassotalea euphylliae]|uniref:Transcriptional antiterminator n=1 Tax=Thalassotalea euphylliae TaxID=1655234 RepID=A0A3E0U2Y6_9GAMM|nr:Tn7-like element transposition protein TnsE [Thalassotalea euphylliae]REL31288.1 transcriptional antiterminator [Thalassotalea euphylliae]